MLNDLFAFVDQHLDESLDQLTELCAQPSVAAQGLGMAECADLVLGYLGQIGAHTEAVPTDGFPVLCGDLPGASSRTLSFYNHYDVQPPDPLDEWISPPFSPTLRDGSLFARGVSDNKGDLVARIAAVRAWQAVRGELPVGLRFIVDGEEEIGSPHLHQFVERRPDLLAADGNIWESGLREDDGRPALFLGLKGICGVELRARTAATDIHSSWGGVAPNAAWRLVHALASIKGADERVRIRGFYDRALPPTQDELAALDELPCDGGAWRRQFGLSSFVMDLPARELLRRHIFEPLVNVDGIGGGYQGQGSKTVLPREAFAKIDIRLVAGQTPAEIVELLRAHLAESGFADIEVHPGGSAMPAKTPMDAPLARIVAETAQAVYGVPPTIYPSMAGSGPMYLMCQAHGIASVMAGVGYSGSSAHAPNEHIRVEDFALGIKHIVAIVAAFAAG